MTNPALKSRTSVAVVTPPVRTSGRDDRVGGSTRIIMTKARPEAPGWDGDGDPNERDGTAGCAHAVRASSARTVVATGFIVMGLATAPRPRIEDQILSQSVVDDAGGKEAVDDADATDNHRP